MFKMMLGILALVAGLISPSLSQAAYPERPITVVVPFAAGGETDLVARMLADSMGTILGQTVAVQNMVGASGVAGISAVLNAKPDGYTLGVTPSAPLAMHPHMRKVPYTLNDFTFVGRILKAPYFVLVDKKSPWNTLDDMLKDMKANPNKYFFASSGVGSAPYFAMKDLFDKAAVKARHVPFSGDADAFQALAGNRVQVYTSTAGSINQFDTKPLAILDIAPDSGLPSIPVATEAAGAPVIYSQWMPVFGPKGVPAEVLNKLEGAMKQALETPELKERFAKLNLAPGFMDAKECTAFVADESLRNAAIIKELSSQQ